MLFFSSKVLTKPSRKSVLYIFMLMIGLFLASFVCQAQDGAVDSSFAPRLDPGAVFATKIQPDGKILIGGFFITVNGILRNSIARLNVDGTLDTTFNPGAGTDNVVLKIAVDSTGRVVIGGFFTTVNGVSRNRIARLNPDGSLDTSFNPGTGANDIVSALAVDRSNRILIGGQFTSVNGTRRNRIARLNSNGTLDQTFDAQMPDEILSTLHAILVDENEKVVIAGEFSMVNGMGRKNIARLNSNGTVDTSFDPGTGTNAGILDLTFDGSGRILIVGSFSLFNNGIRNFIARLNPNGIPDLTFNSAVGGMRIDTVSIDANGKIVIGGDFALVFSSPRNNIARLNIDGSLDSTFNPGGGSNSEILTTSVDKSNRVIVGGAFTTIGGTSRTGIARLLSQSSPSCSYSFAPTNNTATASGGTGSVNVNATSGCTWMAVSNQAWLTIHSGASGTGDGTIEYTVAPNTGDQRSATISINGAASQPFTLSQSAGGPPPDTVPPTVEVVAPMSGEKLKRGKSSLIIWQSSDNIGITDHEILLSTDGGDTYSIQIATGLTGNIQSFSWMIPKTLSKTRNAQIRIIASDEAGNKGQNDSVVFRIR